MGRWLAIVTLFGISLQITGCWVRIPENSHPQYSHYIGRTVKTTVDLFIPDTFFLFKPEAVPDKKYIPKGSDYMTVPAGSVLKITGIASRRLEPGKYYYFKCEWDSDGETITFDYGTGDHIDGKWVEAPYFEFADRQSTKGEI